LEGEGNDPNMLGAAEQFMWVFGKVPQLADRLKCFKYMVDFEPKKIDLKPDIDTLDKVSAFVKNDKRIAKILEIILHVGNFLNAGNRRLGQAAGFDLETLTKLNDTKTTDNKLTILEVIVEMIKDQNPELLKFDKSELELIDEGARVSLQTLEGDLKNLRKNFDSTAQLAPTINPVTDDKFPQRYKDFEEKAKVDLETMEKDFSDANAKYETVVLAFGEDPKKMGPEEFFLVWKTFCGRVVEISDKIDVERDKAEKLRQREKKRKKKHLKHPQEEVVHQEEVVPDLVEELVKNLLVVKQEVNQVVNQVVKNQLEVKEVELQEAEEVQEEEVQVPEVEAEVVVEETLKIRM